MSVDTRDRGVRWVRWFGDDEARELAVVGGKGANLARLVAAGFTVPPGFCVTAAAYAHAIEKAGIAEQVTGQVQGKGAAEGGSARARALIRAIRMPSQIETQIRGAYGEMGDETPVAVRSSATAEDLPEASFAGQQDTYLNIRGEEALVDAVQRCWASLWSDRAVRYRIEHGFAHEDVRLAVVVQAMIESEVAGVMFTANPVSGRRDETVVNASYGLGESVVSGLVTPDTFVVQPGRGTVRSRDIGRKEREIVYGDGGTVEERDVEGSRAARASLTDEQVLELADVGQRIADYYEAPQDVEWALHEGAFYVLQSRPITTLDAQAPVDGSEHWTRAMFAEILPDAPSPVFCSVLVPVFAHMFSFTFEQLRLRVPTGIAPCAVWYHQPYFNVGYIRAALGGLPDHTAAELTNRIANPFDESSTAPPRSGPPALAEVRLVLRVLQLARTLPEEVQGVVRRYYEQLEHYARKDPASLPLGDAVADMRAIALDVLPPLVAYDFLLIAVLGFTQRIVDACVARSGLPDPEHLRGELMSGVTGNVTMETNKRLWRLAQEARRHPAVVAELQQGPDGTVRDRVRKVEGGEAFERELGAFLDEFGHREVKMDVAVPTWKEDWQPVLGFVRSYLSAADAPDPTLQEQVLSEQRQRAAQRVSEALSSQASGRLLHRRLFAWALDKTERLGRERDTMHFHWTASFPLLRSYLHAVGADLVAAGRLDRRSDIFYVTLDRIEACVSDDARLQDEVAESRASWERDAARPWPVEIRYGEEVYDEPPVAHEMGRESMRGVAGSPGVMTGRVRVITGPEEFGRLERGDVLVAPLTNPVWTPLFAVAGALVTDSGGILSHGAIVAREYGIPAVMGVRGASKALRDGQRVIVDGSSGTVTLEEGPD